jgi:hypothetical protein
MNRRASKIINFAMCLMAAGFLLYQQGATPARAAANQQQLSDFLADPKALLAQNPDGGAKLVQAIRDLLLADPAAVGAACSKVVRPGQSNCILSAIIALLGSANPAQQSAMGSGAGQAAQALISINPALAYLIQTAFATEGPGPATAAYSATTGNVQIGATGGGAGGPGAASGPVNGGPPIGGAGATGFGNPSTSTGTQATGLTGGNVNGNTGTNGNSNSASSTTVTISESNSAI